MFTRFELGPLLITVVCDAQTFADRTSTGASAMKKRGKSARNHMEKTVDGNFKADSLSMNCGRSSFLA